MDTSNYIIDPEGEVIIILHNENSPFAQATGDPRTRRKFDFSQFLFCNPLSSQGLTSVPRFSYKPLELSLKEQAGERKDKKKKKKRDKKSKPAVEEPAAEEYAAEETAEVPPMDETAAEEYATEEPAAEEPAAEEPAAEEPAAEEYAAEEAVVEVPFAHSGPRIQVSAKHLMFASPVFKRLLTGGWKESIVYFQKGSVEITAEDWDIEALMIVLRAIHGQNNDIPRKLTLEMLAKVAVIADYYECREPLVFLEDMWIEKVDVKIPLAAPRDLMLWLWIAWFFRLPSHFESATSIAMSESDGYIDSLGLPIPKEVIVSINERREKGINDLIDLLDGTRKAFLLRDRGCCLECSSIMYGALTIQSNDLLLSKPEWPFPNLSYKSLVQTIMAIKSPRWYDSESRYSGYGSSSKHSCPEASFASIFGGLGKSLEGFELNQFTSP
ncbi:uncharacterized protein N7496_003255 [Penicillium cataractarum]|uniref:BTB domain-containing protein n=1 Tax=Penicillium cataractarum TaxID=2100454 RepID=A0A9W9SLR8_9EURO|nr:uncharacterized protein N7496_003255 [Penicillium cataractarum]KAJ5380827.1 hypothetical protein N7496_003255 [Penicillium cataractarum]